VLKIGRQKVEGATRGLSVLRPLNRAVKFQASGSIRRLNSLAANASSKLMRTTYKPCDSAADRNSG